VSDWETVREVGARQRFLVTPHYEGYLAVLARLRLFAPDELVELLTESWPFVAPRRLTAAYERAESRS